MHWRVAVCGDELVEHGYERLTPLVTASSALNGDLSKVRPGDCVVAFSRREIFQLKASVEAASGLQCGVVYGSLPPETRREQARLFNDPGAAQEVLVAGIDGLPDTFRFEANTTAAFYTALLVALVYLFQGLRAAPAEGATP